MGVTINIRHLEEGPKRLKGEASAKDLQLDEIKDELISVTEPLHYDVEIEKNERNLLVAGELRLNLDCQCARCLKDFKWALELAPYHAYVSLEGDDATPVVNDLVDLGPFFREDMLLALPQNPLCSEDCAGLVSASGSKSDHPAAGHTGASAWSELDKLKL